VTKRLLESERLVPEALANVVCPLTVSAEEEALPRVVCPVTFNVPLEVRDEVAVMEPPVIEPAVRVVMKEVTAFRRVAKRLEEVALVAKRFEVEAFVAAKSFVAVAFRTVRLVMVPLVL
jgi:hypothetical protein